MSGKKGRFGKFGGQFVPEALMAALIELENSYHKISRDPVFVRELGIILKITQDGQRH